MGARNREEIFSRLRFRGRFTSQVAMRCGQAIRTAVQQCLIAGTKTVANRIAGGIQARNGVAIFIEHLQVLVAANTAECAIEQIRHLQAWYGPSSIGSR